MFKDPINVKTPSDPCADCGNVNRDKDIWLNIQFSYIYYKITDSIY